MNAPTNANLLVTEGGALELSPKAAALAAKDVAKLNSLSYSELAAGWKNIPSELAELRGWLLWRWVMKPKADKPTKVPVYAKTLQNRSGEQGTEADRGNLCTLAEAIDVLRRVKKTDFAGVGLAMLADWNITALDFDHVIDGEKVAPWVSELVDVNVTYGEASPSDTGARVFYRGLMPPALRDKKHKEGDTGFETFCTKGFVTVTGKELGLFSVMGDPLPQLPEGVVTFAEQRFGRARTDLGTPAFDPDCPFSSIARQHADVDLEGLRFILDNLDLDKCYNRDTWLTTILAVHHQFHGTEVELDALELVDEWSQKVPEKFVGGVVAAYWEDAKSQRTDGLVTIGTLKAWIGLEKWKSYLATRKVAASAAVVVEAGWRERIASADAVTLKGPLAAEIRAAKLEKIDRETLVKHVQRRLAALEGVSPSIAAVRDLLAAPQPAMVAADDAELGDALSLAPAWAQPWVWDAGADCYVHRRTKEERTITSFNAEFARNGADLIVGDERFDPHTMMTRFWRVPVVSGRMYYPPADSRDPIITFEAVRYLNSFRADLVVKPDAKVTPSGERLRKALERHLSMLTPDARESALLRYWLAHNYMHPGVKIRWAPTIKGCEGDGKTVFLDVLGVVLGAANARTLNGDTVLNSTFTGWAEGAAVVMVEEIRFQGHNRFEVANRLKPYITNDRVDVHAKGRDPRTVLNATNYMFATNHVDMLPIDDGDRRYFVLHSPFERKELMEAALQKRFGLSRKEHFAEIKALAAAHPGQLALWLAESERPAEFNENGDAPVTSARGITIQASRETDAEECVRRVLEEGAAGVRDQEAAAALSAWRDAPEDVDLRQEADRACALAGWPSLPRTHDGEGWKAFSAVRSQQGTAPLVVGVGPAVVAFERLVDVLGDGRKVPSVRQIREALHAAGFQPLPGPPSRGSRARQVRWNGALCSIWVRDELLGADEACIRAELGRTLSAVFE